MRKLYYTLFLYILKMLRRSNQWATSENFNTLRGNVNHIYWGIKGELLGSQYMEIGDGTGFGDYFYLTCWDMYEYKTNKGKKEIQRFFPSLKIGRNCRFGAFNHITCINSVTIGNNLLTGKWVTITDNSHGNTDSESLLIEPLLRPLISKGGVIIEDDVWIGDKVTILPGVKIGKGAVIAANAVVTKDVPSYSVVGGIPASIISSKKK